MRMIWGIVDINKLEAITLYLFFFSVVFPLQIGRRVFNKEFWSYYKTFWDFLENVLRESFGRGVSEAYTGSGINYYQEHYAYRLNTN